MYSLERNFFIKKIDDAVVIDFMKPGLKKETLKINAVRNYDNTFNVKLSAVDRFDNSHEESYKIYTASTLDFKKATASYTDGILTVSIPLDEQSKSSQFNISLS